MVDLAIEGSISLYTLIHKKNVFYCFGCHAKGDIIEFVRRIKELGYKKRSD